MSRTKHLERDERRTDRALARQRRQAELIGDYRREARESNARALAMVTNSLAGVGL